MKKLSIVLALCSIGAFAAGIKPGIYTDGKGGEVAIDATEDGLSVSISTYNKNESSCEAEGSLFDDKLNLEDEDGNVCIVTFDPKGAGFKTTMMGNCNKYCAPKVTMNATWKAKKK